MALIDNPKALHEYLVRLANEAFVATHDRQAGEYPAEAFKRRVRERLAQGAQTIVAEVEAIRIELDILRAERVTLSEMVSARDAEIGRLRAEIEVHRSSGVVVGACYRHRDGEVVRVIGPNKPDGTFPRTWRCVVVVASTEHEYDDGAVGMSCDREIAARWVYVPEVLA